VTVQEITVTTNNKALNRIVAANPLNVAVTGAATGLAAGQFLTVTKQNIASLGVGAGASACALCLNAGMASVDFVAMKVVAAPAIAFTAGAANTGTGINLVVTTEAAGSLPAGAADAFVPRVEVVTGGLAAALAFRYSLDDGVSWVATQKGSAGAISLYCKAVGTASQVKAGFQITFGTGTYAAGDSFSALTFGPSNAAWAVAGDGSIKDAGVQFANAGQKYSHVLVANQQIALVTNAANVTAFSTLIGTGGEIDQMVTSLYTNDIPAQVFTTAPRDYLGAPEISTAALSLGLAVSTTLNTYNAANGINLCVGYGHHLIPDPVCQTNTWRNAAWTALQRIILNGGPGTTIYEATPISCVQPGRAPAVNTKLDYTGPLQFGYTYDERQATNLSGSYGLMSPIGIIATSTSVESSIPGASYFIAQPTWSNPSGDFFEGAYKEQMNLMQAVVNRYMWVNYKGKFLATMTDGTGRLTESQCRTIEQAVTNYLNETLVKPGYLPANPSDKPNFIIVDRSVNVVSTQTLAWDAGFYAQGIVKFFSVRQSLRI
jgi:hypothetical protein